MKKLLTILAVLLLSGCAGLRYGNFTPDAADKDHFLAGDAVSQITRIFPPARNTFCLRQKVCDGFGKALIQGLREKGYGIRENICSKNEANFYYVLDETEPHRIFRVSLYIGPQTLSRAYSVAGKNTFPVTPWSFKE